MASALTRGGVTRRALIITLTALLVFATLVFAPNVPEARAEQSGSYVFVFEHSDATRTTIQGTFLDAQGFNVYVADAGGTSKENPSGVTIHMSCSDDFADGWGATAGPDPVVDSEWRVFDYFIQKAQGAPCGNPDLIEFQPAPDIDIEKKTNGEDADVPTGPLVPVTELVMWEFTVTNTGNVPLTDVTVTDSFLESGEISCPASQLAVGESMTCNASDEAFYSRAHKQHQNTATATGSYEGTTVQDSDPSHYKPTLFCPIPTTAQSIVIDIASADPAGEAGFMLGSGLEGDPVGPIAVDIPAGSYRVRLAGYDSHSHKVDQSQEAEQYKVTLQNGWESSSTPDLPETEDLAWWTVDEETEITSNGTTLYAVHTGPADKIESIYAICAVFDPVAKPSPAIEVVKTGEFQDESGDGYAQAGETISYAFAVTNSGNVTLTNVTIDDLVGGVTVSGGPIASLAPGATDSTTFTGSYAVTQADIDAGLFDNTAEACGIDPNEDEVCDTDDHREPLPQNPAIDVDKSPDITPVPTDATTAVTWTIKVTNVGNVTLSNVTVADVFNGVASGVCSLDAAEVAAIHGSATLLVGASFSYQCTIDVTYAAGDFVSRVNVATANATAPNQTPVTDSDTATVVPFEIEASGLIGDFVWNDLDGDGIQDAGEPGIKGAKVKLTNLDTNAVSTQTTNAEGKYLFAALPAGNYRVELDMTSVSGKLTTAGSFTLFLPDGGQDLDNDFGLLEELPVTGLDTERLGIIALVLLAAGGMLLLVTRKRREDEGDVV